MLPFFMTLLPLAAQEEHGYGFLNVVNLIPGDLPADVTIAGKTLLPDGIAPGSATGWFMVPTGDTAMTISLDQPEDAEPRIKKSSGEIPLIDGVSKVIAIYLHPDPRTMPDGTPFPPRIRIHSFPAFDGKGFSLRLVSVCPEIKRFQIGPNLLEAKPFEIVEIPNWTGAPFEISHNGKPIGNAIGSSEQASFYLFIGTNPTGDHVTVLSRSGSQTVPPWMKKNTTQP